jgi:hypothetical protein
VHPQQAQLSRDYKPPVPQHPPATAPHVRVGTRKPGER